MRNPKKTVWKDATTPPTNYLWLKLDPFGDIEGLYEWNGIKWVPIKINGSALSFTDLEGNKVEVSDSIAKEDGTIELVDKDGNTVATILTPDSSSSIIDETEVTEIVNNVLQETLIESTTDAEGNVTNNLKEEIIQNILNKLEWEEDS